MILQNQPKNENFGLKSRQKSWLTKVRVKIVTKIFPESLVKILTDLLSFNTRTITDPSRAYKQNLKETWASKYLLIVPLAKRFFEFDLAHGATPFVRHRERNQVSLCFYAGRI